MKSASNGFEQHQSEIRAIALINQEWDAGWSALQEFEGEDPIQLAAACREYFDLFIAKTREFTHLPCSVDATCSGQQIIAGQLRNSELAELVNVLPTDRPGDIYRKVMDTMLGDNPDKPAHQHLRQTTLRKLASKLGRELSKAGFMSAQYGSGLKRQLIDIAEKAGDRGINFNASEWGWFVGKPAEQDSDWKHQVTPSKSAWAWAMEEVTKLKQTFQWFSSVAKAVHQSGAVEMLLPLPTGSVIKQTYFELDEHRVDTFYLGSSTVSCRSQVMVESDRPDEVKWRTASAANQIHGLDASLLCIALEQFPHTFFACHDSVSTYAGAAMDELQTNLRHAYVEVAEFNMWDEVLKANELSMIK